jgi:predicted PurR-regulated permease PerM
MVFYPVEFANPYLWLVIIAWMAFFAFASWPIVTYLKRLKSGDHRQQLFSQVLRILYLVVLVGGGAVLCFLVIQSP